MGSWHIENGNLHIEMPAPHSQVLPYFPQYDIGKPAPGTIVAYDDPRNVAGHQQRGLLCYYATRAFVESGGGVALDLGSAGVLHIGCLNLDMYGNGETPFYGGVVSGVNVKADASDLSMFQDNSFSCVLNSHLTEHLPCRKMRHDVTQEERFQFGCLGLEIIPILRDHWIRVLRPGGYLAMIIPDETFGLQCGSSTLYFDNSHQHAWTADAFYDDIVRFLEDLVEIVSFNTLQNNFSMELVARKR